jgi:hypothetical protein
MSRGLRGVEGGVREGSEGKERRASTNRVSWHQKAEKEGVRECKIRSQENREFIGPLNCRASAVTSALDRP